MTDMHLYDQFVQKNRRNILRALKGFPEAERSLILEFLGEYAVVSESSIPFFRQLVESLVRQGYELHSTGDLGVVLFLSFIHPEMRRFFKSVKEKVSKVQAELLFASTEEQTKAGEELGMQLGRAFLLTMGRIHGTEYVIDTSTQMADRAKTEKAMEWLKNSFAPKVMELL